MANVSVIQRHAHLAGAVKLEFVNGREGKFAKAVLTAISNSRRGSGEQREEQATAMRWTLWGKQAERLRSVRQAVLDEAFHSTPNRFKGRCPQPHALPTAVWINPPSQETIDPNSSQPCAVNL